MAQEVSRFVVGIDLGTTNSAVCYIDTADARWQVHTLAIPQVVAARRGRSARHASLVSL